MSPLESCFADLRADDGVERIYLSGPMSGIADLNYPAFHQWAAILGQYTQVRSPADPDDIDEDGKQKDTWENYLSRDIVDMMGCDALFVLPDWEASPGATLELLIMASVNRPCIALPRSDSDAYEEIDPLKIYEAYAATHWPEFLTVPPVPGCCVEGFDAAGESSPEHGVLSFSLPAVPFPVPWPTVTEPEIDPLPGRPEPYTPLPAPEPLPSEFPDVASDFPLPENTETKGGTRYSKGKARGTICPTRGFEGIMEVGEYGATKYDDNDWRKGQSYTTLINSAFRHLLALLRGGTHDPESGLHHASHAAWNMATLVHFDKEGRASELDDRENWTNVRGGAKVPYMVHPTRPPNDTEGSAAE